MEDSGYRRLNPKCRIAMYLKNVIYAAFFTLIMLTVILTFFSGSGYEIPMIVGFLVLGAAILYWIVAPIIFYWRYRYILTDDRVDIRRGIIVVRHTLVPIERVHQVEVVRGPISNMLGLADVVVTTAGGSVCIQYLELAEAERVAQELNKHVNRILKDRKKNE